MVQLRDPQAKHRGPDDAALQAGFSPWAIALTPCVYKNVESRMSQSFLGQMVPAQGSVGILDIGDISLLPFSPRSSLLFGCYTPKAVSCQKCLSVTDVTVST